MLGESERADGCVWGVDGPRRCLDSPAPAAGANREGRREGTAVPAPAAACKHTFGRQTRLGVLRLCACACMGVLHAAACMVACWQHARALTGGRQRWARTSTQRTELLAKQPLNQSYNTAYVIIRRGMAGCSAWHARLLGCSGAAAAWHGTSRLAPTRECMLYPQGRAWHGIWRGVAHGMAALPPKGPKHGALPACLGWQHSYLDAGQQLEGLAQHADVALQPRSEVVRPAQAPSCNQ